MRAFHADASVRQLPPGHRFPMHKYQLLMEQVQASLPDVSFTLAEPASEGELALAHHPDYVAAVFEGRLSREQQRAIGFPWTPEMVMRSRRSVGATVAAARAALHEGVSATLSGGTHHASADEGGGYCVFNDLAVAARLMQAEWMRLRRQPLRVAIVDLDVHQGNGTASIFRDDPSVYTLSMHGEKNFPFRKVAGDLDVDLPDGCTDGPYLEALDRALAQLWAAHAGQPPGLLLYQAGADPHEGDRLGRLKISAAGLAERDRRVLAAARERDIPVVVTMGGGYGHVIEHTVAVQLQTYHEAHASWQAWARRL
ncbi:acetoin utilization deacetylase AcuC-like enzyme [Sphaerotilus hippei]|uniref:Acetoin utilization deacetylase AcuC-like enzyme n=1 Tax=Sphaerotilus hippei TaxID=744406 RepID=A0A318H3R1_9BURK|nr:histone deacetylase [Sphaerotilus hippei]PXW98090.1 acetoin utilization deacetylase AcuC-like enzyme [Sphaerotilus hippei]